MNWQTGVYFGGVVAAIALTGPWPVRPGDNALEAAYEK